MTGGRRECLGGQTVWGEKCPPGGIVQKNYTWEKLSDECFGRVVNCQEMTWGIVRATVRGEIVLGMSSRNTGGGATSEKNAQLPKPDYKSLSVAVMICDTLVNTRTHTQLLTGCTISSAS